MIETNISSYRKYLLTEMCGVDGGNPGTPESPSTWLLGLEPGKAKNDASSESLYSQKARAYDIDLQLTWRFNCQAFHLLAAIEGSNNSYEDFARLHQPFATSESRYFKANLYPLPCNNMADFPDEAKLRTGFADKVSYRRWVEENRFQVIRKMIDRCQPRLVIATGTTYRAKFESITFGDVGSLAFHDIPIKGRSKRVYQRREGERHLFVIPHLSGAYALNTPEAAKVVGAFVRGQIRSE
ncbi:hypothetical protein PQU92_17255 [Asticcacaulis sp. BYS171W]|uniref:Uracil-DNA glycosylase-like domain-containing protein n=1 Tax=Asticcacaulis aquaticus TaxID=2984212 RepID=A0ABT5HY80_9CAUL|nr:hypothetical protein [Asticcacaulis aquaticus]MDC7685035.1 hypothetical protein [Asticcacaulis aquaticus]